MFNPYMILLLMAVVGFVLGLLTFITGILILLFRPSNQDVKTLIAQTATLAQKGIAEDIAGLVGHTSSLLESLNQLVRTTSGVGVLLIVVRLTHHGRVVIPCLAVIDDGFQRHFQAPRLR